MARVSFEVARTGRVIEKTIEVPAFGGEVVLRKPNARRILELLPAMQSLPSTSGVGIGDEHIEGMACIVAACIVDPDGHTWADKPGAIELLQSEFGALLLLVTEALELIGLKGADAEKKS